MSAAAVAKDVFAQRKIGADQVPTASPTLLPLDEAAEAKRAANVEQQFSKVAPGIVQYTTTRCACAADPTFRMRTAVSVLTNSRLLKTAPQKIANKYRSGLGAPDLPRSNRCLQGSR
jgi:hypothetical protein